MQRREIAPWLPIVILALGSAIIFYRLILGEVLYWGLPSLQYYPWRQFAFNELSFGRLPYWNPYVGGGAPLMANYQSAIFYPPNWIHLVVREAEAMSILFFAHILWAGWGMWLFGKDLGLSTIARGVSVICFALGSYTLSQSGDFPLVNTAAWLPWLFWANSRLLSTHQMRYVGGLGLIAGIQLLAGHLQTSWYSYISIALFTLWYVLSPLQNINLREQITGISQVIFAFVIGAGIASFQLFLTLEYLFMSHRAGGVSFETLAAESYAPWQLLTLFAPTLFGSPGDGSYLLEPSSGNYIGYLYIGFLPLLSVFSAVRGWMRHRTFMSRRDIFKTVPFWLGLSILGVVLSLGRYTPIYEFLYHYVPTFDGFRGPMRWLLLPSFGLAVLAGIGVHSWQITPQFQNRVRVIGTSLLAGLMFLGIFISVTQLNFEIERVFLTAIALIFVNTIVSMALVLTKPDPLKTGNGRWQVALLLFIVIDLGIAGQRLVPTVPHNFYERDLSVSHTQGRLYWDEDYSLSLLENRYFKPTDYRSARERWTDIRTSLLPNLNMLSRNASFNNYDLLQPAVHREYVELIETSLHNQTSIMLGAGIGEVYSPTRPPGWEGELRQYTAPNEPKVVWLVQNAVWVESNDAAKAYMQSLAWYPYNQVILFHEEDITPPAGFEPYPTYTDATVEIIYQRPTEHRYRVQSDGSGYLVIPTTWYPGWKAEINGRSTKLYRANLAFQAIEIPEGDVEITLSYTPTGIEVSYLISIIVIFGSIGLIAYDLFRYGGSD